MNRQQRYELRHAEKRKARHTAPRGAYLAQRRMALRRGIEWLFTFETWWEMWKDLFYLRGRRRDNLCMSRFGDSGPYSPTNVEIIPKHENDRRRELAKHV